MLLSHSDRTRVIAPEAKGRSWAGNQAYCTLLVDGFLGGLWRLARGTLTVELFDAPSKAQKDEIVAEGERLLAEMTETEGPGSVRFGSIRG